MDDSTAKLSPNMASSVEVELTDLSSQGVSEVAMKSIMLQIIPNIDIEITKQDIDAAMESELHENGGVKQGHETVQIESMENNESKNASSLDAPNDISEQVSSIGTVTQEYKPDITQAATLPTNPEENADKSTDDVKHDAYLVNESVEKTTFKSEVPAVEIEMNADEECDDDEAGSSTESALLMKADLKTKQMKENGDGQTERDSNGSLADNGRRGVDIEDLKPRRLFYRVSEHPPIRETIFFAIQQMLTSFSRTLTVSVLVAELVCGQDDEVLKTRLLATTSLCNGISTILMSTVGVRLPIYQGPASAYIVPLIAMMSLKDFSCPDRHAFPPGFRNESNTNSTGPSYYEEYTEPRLRMLSGSLILAGVFQTVVGLTGIVGFLLRFIGPVTIVPTLSIVGLYLYRTVMKFMSTHWGISGLTSLTGIVCALYLRNITMPLLWWTRKRGFFVFRSRFHRSFSILIALGVGWIFSAILTAAGAMTDDPTNPQYSARPDAKLHVIADTSWFLFPYPGQFGTPSFSAAVIASFILASVSAILDSIGDYYACSRACFVPPPPAAAVSRGIMVEGVMSAFAGACGIGHATTSFGGNIGVIGITKVASRRVFIVLGLMYIIFALFGKLGAIFVTVPIAVLGGVQIISFGIFVGVILSNLQYVDLRSTRNLAIIGISMLIGLILPIWTTQYPDGINTGVRELNNVIKMLLANPFFACGIMACFLDNTVPGTLKERGLLAWLVDEPTVHGEEHKPEEKTSDLEEGNEVYDLPFLPYSIRWGKLSKYIPIMPGYSFARGKRSVLETLEKESAKSK